jgi:hypothetical protein
LWTTLKVPLAEGKGLLMNLLTCSHQRILSILEREAEDITARREVYGILHFREHPAPRLAESLEEVLRDISVEEILQQLSKNKSKSRQWYYDKLKLMIIGDRSLFRRSKGCAAYIIDSVAKAIGTAPYRIYTSPNTYNVSQFVRRRVEWLLNKPGRLNNKEKMYIRTQAIQLAGKEVNITASWLKDATKDTSLPPYYFIMNGKEWEKYETFRESAKLTVNEIISFYLRDDFLRSLRSFVTKNYPRLLRKVEGNSPDDYIDKIYDKFRQQVLDGNTYFSNYKLTVKSYLHQILKNVLRDHCKKLKKETNGRNEISVSQLERKDSKWEFLDNSREPSMEPKFLCKVLLAATQDIPSKEDREVLRTALINVPFFQGNKEQLDGKKARKALRLWAPKILQNLGRDVVEELPVELRKQLYYYANSLYAKMRKNLLMCSKIAKEQGRDHCWLAEQLMVSKSSLEKWIRCDSFPKRETLELIRSHISFVKKLLGISGDEATVN